ncbi:hypothetical protein HB375_01045 [Microvirga sp. c23x22]|uniref:Yip1 domain-containing protein n=2 Tax=Microvirga terricola TaxID=2719797 RepID=A0ABX0V6I9_9HYPH|nr:hypothetical protein [Microvirga terricola]
MRHIGLRDVRQGGAQSRLRLLAPLRYLRVHNEEKARYDFIIPLILALGGWALYTLIEPKPPLFGEKGLLKFARDLLIMAVPFMVGALATVAMASQGPSLDSRPPGPELYLDGQALTLRQFVCYLLGYLCFLGLVILGATVGAELMHDTILAWVKGLPHLKKTIHAIGTLLLAGLLASFTVTIFWSLYFMTDVINRRARS